MMDKEHVDHHLRWMVYNVVALDRQFHFRRIMRMVCKVIALLSPGSLAFIGFLCNVILFQDNEYF
jgi:hypothetical protein